MRDLELYLDSKLKSMKLYDYAQKILKSITLDQDDTIPNKQLAIDVYTEFVELASMIDGFSNWGEKEWANFVSMMNLAFREKGKENALSCALASIYGLILGTDGVKIKDVYTSVGSSETCQTQVTFTVQQINTPFTSRFIEKLKTLIPKLYWIHELEIMSETELFKTVYTDIKIVKTYNKNIYSRDLNYMDLTTAEEEQAITVPQGWNLVEV